MLFLAAHTNTYIIQDSDQLTNWQLELTFCVCGTLDNLEYHVFQAGVVGISVHRGSEASRSHGDDTLNLVQGPQ